MTLKVNRHMQLAAACFLVGNLIVVTAGSAMTPRVPQLQRQGRGRIPTATWRTRVSLWDRRFSQVNVSQLKERWSFKLRGDAAEKVGGYGPLAAGPIVVNGVVYMQDLHSNVYALTLATGRLLWEYVVNKPELSGPGPNGVAVVDGTVYAASPHTAFALTAATGKQIWVNKKLLKRHQGTFGIQPAVANGRVYLASQYGSGSGGGVLLALNASTGALLWKFNTIVDTDKDLDALGLGGGGAWETPLVGTDGSVTFGIGNPYQSAAWRSRIQTNCSTPTAT